MRALTDQFFSIHNIYNLSLKGRGNLFDYLSYQYHFFRKTQPKTLQENDLAVEVGQASHLSAEWELGDNKQSYKRAKDSFIWQIQSAQALLDGSKPLIEQTQLCFDNSWPKMKGNLLLELLMRFKFVQQETVLIHAACASKSDQAVVLPAWKATGKTTACLELLKEGFQFLADDKVWLSANGMVYANPRYIVIKDTNFYENRDLLDWKMKAQAAIRATITSACSLCLPQKIAQPINGAIKLKPTYYTLSELLPQATITYSAPLSQVILLAKKLRQAEFNLEPYSTDQMATMIQHINNIEWNYKLKELASAHDLLFPEGPNWASELHSLLLKEEMAIQKACAYSHCHKAVVPANEKQRDWPSLSRIISAKDLRANA